jgi:hypothetical protein
MSYSCRWDCDVHKRVCSFPGGVYCGSAHGTLLCEPFEWHCMRLRYSWSMPSYVIKPTLQWHCMRLRYTGHMRSYVIKPPPAHASAQFSLWLAVDMVQLQRLVSARCATIGDDFACSGCNAPWLTCFVSFVEVDYCTPACLSHTCLPSAHLLPLLWLTCFVSFVEVD